MGSKKMGRGGDLLIRRGIQAFNRGAYADAERLFAAAVQADSRCPTAYGFWSAALRAEGRYEEALQAIEKAIRLKPRCARLLLESAKLFSEMSRGQEALRNCVKAIDLAPRLAAAYEMKASIEKSMILGARSSRTQCEAARVTEPEDRKRQAAVALMDGDKRRAAFKECRQAVRLDHGLPGTRESALDRVQAVHRLRDLDLQREALAQCRAALRLDPRCRPALEAKAVVEWEWGMRRRAVQSVRRMIALLPNLIEVRVSASRFYRNIGEFQAALSCLQEAMGRGLKSAEACVELGLLHLWHGELDEALVCAGNALSMDGNAPAARRVRGAAYVLKGTPSRAINDLNDAVANHPDDREALVWRAEAKRRLGRLSAAMTDLRTAQAESADGWSLGAAVNRALIKLATSKSLSEKENEYICNAVPWRNLGLSVGRGTVRPGVLRGALRLMKGNRGTPATWDFRDGGQGRYKERIHYGLRMTTMQLQSAVRFGDVQRVLDEFSALIAEDPLEPYYHEARGEVCLWVGLYAEASRSLFRGLELGPRRPWPNTGLCGVFVAQGHFPEALEHLKLAERNGAPERALAHWRGEIYRKLGDPRRALAEFDKSVDVFPFRLSLWFNVALARGALGDVRELRSMFTALRRHADTFMAAAAKKAGVTCAPSGGGLDADAMVRTLEAGLVLMRGNRSSWMYTYVPDSGQGVSHIKLGRLRKAQIPPHFSENRWMFDARPKEL